MTLIARAEKERTPRPRGSLPRDIDTPGGGIVLQQRCQRSTGWGRLVKPVGGEIKILEFAGRASGRRQFRFASTPGITVRTSPSVGFEKERTPRPRGSLGPGY